MRIRGLLTALAIVALTVPMPRLSCAQDSPDPSPISKVAITVPIPDAASPAAGQGAGVPDSAAPAPKSTLKEKVQAFVKKITPDRLKRDIEFKTAAETFPQFCQHWEQNLRERETNNLQKLIYTLKQGFETATYTGYGKIAGCECHQSKDGYSIGKITYEEFIYYLTGKTRDEARKTAPQTVSDTHTTEIFRFEKNKWFY
ncbi:MAG: hypothetical protein Q7S58_15325 [Candidatus Binatus sp.]|uniref:hypothetical protein n=1 Tax=Candidatus Binatus sp. TaxID=2811406 RepID=UPI00271AF247|nr:hypothetical protein [Candidatus Binatus sp.]MDO8433772.1 hypothetical protein [Candidatus Binatus sp.]